MGRVTAGIFLCTFIVACYSGACFGEGNVRKSPIAGTWYPGDKQKLIKQVEDYFSLAQPPAVKGRVFALISPHAGIQYSGQAAACGYKLLRNKKITRVIVLGPSHYAGFRGIATSAEDFYETPIGRIKVDREYLMLSIRMLFLKGRARQSFRSILWKCSCRFLQVALGEFTLVPLVVGELSAKEYADAAQALAPYLDSSTVVVASSDFTHYGDRFGYQPFKDHPRENLKSLTTAPLIKSWQRISRASSPMWMRPEPLSAAPGPLA